MQSGFSSVFLVTLNTLSIMSFEEFTQSLANSHPGGGNPLLDALWWDARGDWNKAHEIAQDVASGDGALIHAYLHRKEGDISNAMYWYRQAGESIPDLSLSEEWTKLVRKFL